MSKTLQLSDFPDFIQKGFVNNEPVNIEQVKNKIEDNFEKGLISEDLYCSSMDLLEKGGKRATIGEIREFGGRKYIKTSGGWKFYGKGTGSKAASHVNSRKTDSNKTSSSDTGFDFDKLISGVKGGDLLGYMKDKDGNIKITNRAAGQNDQAEKLGNAALKIVKERYAQSKKTDSSSKDLDEVIRRNAKNIAYAAGISEKEFNGLHDVTKRQLYEDMKKRNSKKDFYAYVNEKFGTTFRDGDIEEFEDEDMRRQLTDEDIKAIVDAEKEESKSKNSNSSKNHPSVSAAKRQAREEKENKQIVIRDYNTGKVVGKINYPADKSVSYNAETINGERRLVVRDYHTNKVLKTKAINGSVTFGVED